MCSNDASMEESTILRKRPLSTSGSASIKRPELNPANGSRRGAAVRLAKKSDILDWTHLRKSLLVHARSPLRQYGMEWLGPHPDDLDGTDRYDLRSLRQPHGLLASHELHARLQSLPSQAAGYGLRSRSHLRRGVGKADVSHEGRGRLGRIILPPPMARPPSGRFGRKSPRD